MECELRTSDSADSFGRDAVESSDRNYIQAVQECCDFLAAEIDGDESMTVETLRLMLPKVPGMIEETHAETKGRRVAELAELAATRMD